MLRRNAAKASPGQLDLRISIRSRQVSDGQVAGWVVKASAIAVATFLAMPNSLTMREMTRPPPRTWNVVAFPVLVEVHGGGGGR